MKLICKFSLMLFMAIPLLSHAIPVPITSKIPVIVDTDMGFDDWMALLYIAKDPSVDIKAVTVDCSGETYCPQGAVNATKLLFLATGNSNIPVYYEQDLSDAKWDSFPALIRVGATDMKVYNYKDQSKEDFKNIKGYSYKSGAAKAIVRIAEQAGREDKPITFISIGSAENLSKAIQLSEGSTYFNDGFKMVYKGGGAFGMPMINNSDGSDYLSNVGVSGNLNIPNIYASNNRQAEWNIYVGAQSMQNILTSGLPLTFVPVNLSDQVPITQNSFDMISKNVDNSHDSAIKFVADAIMTQEVAQGGFDNSGLDYWDPSVVVAALHPGFIKKTYKDNYVCIPSEGYSPPVNTGNAPSSISKSGKIPVWLFEELDNSKGLYSYGETIINAPIDVTTNSIYGMKACNLLGERSGKANVYYSIDTRKFYTNFVNILSNYGVLVKNEYPRQKAASRKRHFF